MQRGNGAGLKGVEGMLLKLANQTSALKKAVDILGGPKDTVDHRHKISATNATIQVRPAGCSNVAGCFRDGRHMTAATHCSDELA